MDRETNIDSIRALEEQIKESERTTIRLKRARNSLLNISKLPPEVLGDIFRWNVTLKGDFDELDKRSHNFLLVCHHWFEVASYTPELWSFWGSTPEDWSRRCHHLGTAPLDLVLAGDDYDESYFNTAVRNVLQDRAAQDTIRRVRLTAEISELMAPIIASLTTNCGEIRSNSIESLILRSECGMPVDMSEFFARYRFPKLQRLDLTNCKISSWDHITSRTSVLTTLDLDFGRKSPTPTTSQLLSTLASNPSLRKVSLFRRAVPEDGGGESSSRVQLHHLKELQLKGGLQHVFELLQRLDHPRNLDNLSLTLFNSDVTAIPRIVGPYLREHFQRRDRLQNGLNLRVSAENPLGFRSCYIEFQAGDAGGIDSSAPKWEQINTFVGITMLLIGSPKKSVLEGAALDLTTYAPSGEVVLFHTYTNPAVTEAAHIQFPNLRALSFDTISLPAAFPNPNLIGDWDIPPSLEHVLLDNVVVECGDLSLLTIFLTHRVSSGNRLDTLVIASSIHVCRQVERDIRDMVRELKIYSQSSLCPFGTCRGP